jgi:Flp pilus assembly protein TadB
VGPSSGQPTTRADTMTALSALGGATAALGLLLVVVGLMGTPDHPPTRRRWRPTRRLRGLDNRSLGMLVGLPLVTLAVTGWPVAALFALVAAIGLPRMLVGRKAAGERIDRLQALADWTRRLGDVLASGSGIEQAIESSATGAPAPISREVARLVSRIRARQPVELALRGFADELADPTGDLVAAALLLAVDRRGRGLARLLAALASTVEAEVAMRRSVEADRATPRTTARWVLYITLTVCGGLFLFDRAYVEPFGSFGGQVMLAVIGALFAASFAWMHRLTSGTLGRRFLPEEART